MRFRIAFAAFVCVCPLPIAAAAGVSARQSDGGVAKLVTTIEQAIRTGDADGLRRLAVDDVRPGPLADFVLTLTGTRASFVSLKERDRAPLESGRVRLLLEILTLQNSEGRVSSWRVDAVPSGSDTAPWKIGDVERLTVVAGLFELALDTTVEYAVHDLVIAAPDLTLTVASGQAFAARTPDGPTAFVVMGRGRMKLAPKPEAERGQLRVFSGAPVFEAAFDGLYIRLNPAQASEQFSQSGMTPRPVDGRHARRAAQIFETYLSKSFEIDLNDLSSAHWSLVPSGSDFVAEVMTKRYGPLTYARAESEPEDISFFDRRRKHNIAVYASEAKLATRGRFFSEDDRLDYDITRYDIEAAFAPESASIEATAHLTLHIRANDVSTLTLRLAEPLVIRRIISPAYGRLLHLRVVGQNNVLIGFPGVLRSDTDVEVVVDYGGRLPPQAVDQEGGSVQQDREQAHVQDQIAIPPEPHYIYSNRSYWYPQATVTGYALARLTLTVPGEFDVVASGTPQGAAETLPAPPGQRGRRKFVFAAGKPVRYLACIISRFQAAPPIPLKLREGGGEVPLIVTANPRAFNRVRSMSEKAGDILRFYSSLMRDAPYDSFTLALTESDLPGGHSPAYFAMLNQPLPTSPFTWTNDPVSFQGYPSFFAAHEIAHQWWGQAVGWKNYHEQWLSEGFAQYFAALYAERERGPEPFVSVLRQMRRWAIDMSPQGPIYLGYRLGHLRSDSRVFRALVYNKGAMVLHMLRRLVGDDAFFAGLRDFYTTWKYKKAGTDDLRSAMEQAAGRPLERFFDRWIYGSAIPVVRFTSEVDGRSLHVRFEQRSGEVFDFPVTVTIAYVDGTTEEVVVAVTDTVVERVIPLKQAVRTVEANRDGGALAEVVR
ncbi:MAG TPA: M1 family aminopeptidase [Vicinamibacterales bacterium]|nr:M1 family aminopeptidase [Vicinamibacterales bacterium]